jgi:hypothetical protein
VGIEPLQGILAPNSAPVISVRRESQSLESVADKKKRAQRRARHFRGNKEGIRVGCAYSRRFANYSGGEAALPGSTRPAGPKCAPVITKFVNRERQFPHRHQPHERDVADQRLEVRIDRVSAALAPDMNNARAS